MSQTILNMTSLSEANVNNDYFPYFVVDNAIQADAIPGLTKDFPEIKFRGSVPPETLSFGSHFQTLIEELEGSQFKSIISDKFGMNLEDNPSMLTVRGCTTERDGRIHTDTDTKIITVLLYFNHHWPYAEGRLRLLRDGSSLDNYFDEVTPTMGKLLAFKVTDNCWHGHYPHIGQRQTIQFNYMTSQQALNSEVKKHKRSSHFKKLTHLFKK